MNLFESVEAIRTADGDGIVDWAAAARAANASTPRGRLDLDEATERAYREAVVEARSAVSRAVGVEVALPATIEVVDRHHWIDQAARSFDRMLAPALPPIEYAPLARTLNTGSAAFTLAFLGRRVIGQYDPALFAAEDDTVLLVVHPNVVSVADELGVDIDPFRRWVLHHEMTHAAEFALAPWLRPHLEERLTAVLTALARGRIDRAGIADLNRIMTAIEGFAELLMDETIDEDVSDLRERLEARRAGLGPVQQLIEWLLGITAKREQYATGRDFFQAVADDRGIGATVAVWADPDALPSDEELADPAAWLERVDP